MECGRRRCDKATSQLLEVAELGYLADVYVVCSQLRYMQLTLGLATLT